MMSEFTPNDRRPSAFTLVELLVAITIASVVTLIALPAIRNALKQNTASRSAEVIRQVFVNARAQAIKSNRPFGVALRRSANTGVNADYCKSLSFMAAPPTYQGDVSTATAVKLAAVGAPTPDPPNILRFGFSRIQCPRLYFEVETYQNSGQMQAIRDVTLRPGAVIYLSDSLGPFRVTGANLKNITHTGVTAMGVELILQTLWPNVPSAQLPFVDGSYYPFEVHGMPMESFLPGVELPRDSAIDLSVSGIGLAGVQFNSQNIRCTTSTDADVALGSDAGFDKVVVMFGPTGDVQQVYTDTWNATTNAYDVQTQLVTGTIYLSIGRSDGILAPETAVGFDTIDAWRGTLPNFASTETVWLSLRTSSGAITLSPQVAPLEPAAAFYTANAITAPPVGTTCANRIEQINVLSLRVINGRRLAKQGAQLQ